MSRSPVLRMGQLVSASVMAGMISFSIGFSVEPSRINRKHTYTKTNIIILQNIIRKEIQMDLKEKFAGERDYYPALMHWIYLDHASGGLYPSYSTEAMKAYLDGMSENSMTFQEFTETWDFADEMRTEVARMFHCQGSEVMYGLSSTWLFNIFMNGIGLRPGDNIITTTNSHAFTPTRVLDLLKKIDVRVVASDKFTNNSTKTCVIEKASLAKLEGYDFFLFPS